LLSVYETKEQKYVKIQPCVSFCVYQIRFCEIFFVKTLTTYMFAKNCQKTQHRYTFALLNVLISKNRVTLWNAYI